MGLWEWEKIFKSVEYIGGKKLITIKQNKNQVRQMDCRFSSLGSDWKIL